MKIKWYWLAEQLGLMEDLSVGNGDVLYRVSAKADDFFEAAFFALIPFFLLTALLLSFLLCRKGHLSRARQIILFGVGVLLVYGILRATGVGPYIQFYPQSAGFIDLSPITNILSGFYCAFLALLWGLGGWLGRKLAHKK